MNVVLPFCYGELHLTGEEIGSITPGEITARLDGYAKRMKNMRILLASFVTAPVINSGMRGPKRPVTAQKLVPQDFKEEISAEKLKSLQQFMEQAERRDDGGKGNKG